MAAQATEGGTLAAGLAEREVHIREEKQTLLPRIIISISLSIRSGSLPQTFLFSFFLIDMEDSQRTCVCVSK